MQAATIEVNSNLDDGSDCTLRDAITSVNNGALEAGCNNAGDTFGTDDTINVAPALAGDTIVLENGQLMIATGSDVSINGNGITVDANQSSGAIYADGVTLAIDDMTITGGLSFGVGGGIRASGSNLDLSSVLVRNNSADFSGGGIFLSSSNMELSDSAVSGSYAAFGSGGGIYIGNSSSVTIINSTISGNASMEGGGIDASFSSSLTLLNSSVSGNSAISSGGGIRVSEYSSVTAENSVVSGNIAERGGGVFATTFYANSINDNSDLTFVNSTISNNGGGGVAVNNAGASLSSSTLSSNYDGNGLETSGISNVNINNTIVTGSGAAVDCVDIDGLSTISSDAASIITNDSCATTARTVDPLLLPLADNGCLVKQTSAFRLACGNTHALAAGSPAIDTALDSSFSTDQIGTPRPQGTAADVGAFELPEGSPTSPGFTVTAVDAVEGIDTHILFTITLDGPQPVLAGYDFRTEAGSAIDGEDYVGRVGRILFPAGETVRERRVTVLDDNVQDEPDETLSLIVTDIYDPQAAVAAQATIKDIASTGSQPTISVAEVRVRERSEIAVVVIRLSEPSLERVSVTYQTSVRPNQNNPAVAGEDYIARSGTIVFQPGQTRAVRNIILIDDADSEANEVFRFELSDPNNAEIASGSERQRVFILNDD